VRIFGEASLADLKPQNTTQHPNHIVLADAVLRLTRHKTSKHEAHRGGITEELSPQFMGVLSDSLARWPRDYMFVDSNGRPFSNQGFSKFVSRTTKRVFGSGDKAPGVSLLRHAFCTALDYNSLTGKERAELALRMGHSSPMQDAYRFLRLDAKAN
jgi:integrase